MSYKQRAINFIEQEWGTYMERFNRLPKEEGLKRVNAQGYVQFRDMLAHVLAWWEEGMPIILAIADNREFERKKYDFDVFNADAVAKYKSWDEKEFLNHFEQTRLKAIADLKAIEENVFDNRRVRAWIRAVFIHHAREHLVACSKFLVLDTLEHEYSTLIEKFDALEDKTEYMKKEGFERFEDILAHIIRWWDEGVKVIEGFKKDSNFVYDEPNVDVFNQEVIAQYKNMDVRNIFEQKRNEMIKLIKESSESIFENQIIERWLAADVVEHFDEHDI